MKIFDTHCHLAGLELMPHAEDLAARAMLAGVEGLAIIAADEQSLKAAPVVAEKLRKARPMQKIVWTAGIHPHDSEPMTDAVWAEVEKLAQQGASAIGETGLDYYYDHSDRTIQKKVFQQHIELAAKLKKPLVIHCRQAVDDVLSMLSQDLVKQHPNPGVLHCFSESLETARTLLDLGFYISFSGIVTFKNAEPLRQVVKFVPKDRLLVETDSPWLAPIPHRGKRNEPAWTADVFRLVCQTRGESPEEFADQIWKNSCKFFGLSI